jgi:putative transposase
LHPRYDLQQERGFSFSDETLAELLCSVGQSNEDPLDLVMDEFRGPMLRKFLEQALEVERDVHLGFLSYERGIPKEDSRNGYYERDIELAVGLIENLRVPRTRKNTYKSKLLENYKRRQRLVERFIREMFTRGVSTRQVGEILKPLLGIEPSSSTVSAIAKSLDEEVRRYKRRAIDDDYIYLILDGVTMKVKEAPHATKKLVLCAYGITSSGRRVLLSFQQESAESQASWERLLNDLVKRGLLGENLKMIVTDGGQGMAAALGVVYPHVPHQRCWAHKLRNVSSRCRKRNEKECISGARLIYLAESRREALRAFRKWRGRWQEEEPGAVECLARDLEEMLPFLHLPEEHRKMMRTTNVIERLFREVRRRTRPMSCFTNAASCDRIIYAVFSRFNRHWESHPLRLFTQQT